MASPTVEPPCFSICIIAKDEAETLPGLAKSVSFFQEHGGEVVLLDTGSTDATLAVAEKHGFRAVASQRAFIGRLNKAQVRKLNERICDPKDGQLFVPNQSCFDFSAARNACAELASNDVVLFLDASDRVRSLDFSHINDMVAAGHNSFHYELMAVDSDGTASLATAHRFYDRRFEEWQGTAHEVLYSKSKEAALNAHQASLSRSALHVVHEKQAGRARRAGYLIGLALDAVMHPNNAIVAHNFGRELMYAGKANSALKLLERHLVMEYAEQSHRAMSACFMGEIWERQGEHIQAEARERLEQKQKAGGEMDEAEAQRLVQQVTGFYDRARAAFFKAFELDCGFRSPLVKLSGLALKMRDGKRAVIWAKAALEVERESIATENSAHYTYKVDELLFRAYYVLWRDATQNKASPTKSAELWHKARDHWVLCKEAAPELKTVQNFAEIFDLDEMIAASGQPETPQ